MRRAVNISSWKTFTKINVCTKPPLLALQFPVPKQWAHHLESCIPVTMKLRHRIYLSDFCTFLIDWKSTRLHMRSFSLLTTFSLNTNSSFLQLSTGSEYFKIIKSNVWACKELCFCKLLVIKSPVNANGHCRFFLFSIKIDPISGKFDIFGREAHPTVCEAGLTWLHVEAVVEGGATRHVGSRTKLCSHGYVFCNRVQVTFLCLIYKMGL